MKKALQRFLAFVLIIAALMASSVSALAVSYSGSSSYKSSKYYTALTKVTKTGDQRTDIVAIAKSQVGYHEGSKGDLDGVSSSSSNYTEYGRWYGSNGVAWCQIFVSWCANCAGVSTSTVSKASYTETGLKFFKNQGRAYTRAQVASGKYTPQAGDIIYFNSGTKSGRTVDHVGIVYKYSNGTVYTYEGNSSNKVSAKSYSIKNTYIKYICSPNYSGSSSSNINITESKVSLTVGGTTKLSCNKSSGVTWKSSKTSVATVSSNGTVTAKKTGTTTITATCNGKSDTCNVTVTKDAHTTKVTLSSSSVNLGVGSTKQLSATLTPSNSTDSTTWKSSNTKVATVSNGKVTATKKTGTTKITATSNGKTATCTINVYEYFKKCASKYTSIVDALKSIGAQSSFSYRKQIAEINGITNYKGTSSQNTQLLKLLKQGNLLKPW